MQQKYYWFIGIVIIVILGVVIITKPEISHDSRNVNFWGTANIDAQVLKTDFSNQPKIVLKVLKINNYSLDNASEKSLFDGDEITILITGESKSQTVCTPTDIPQDVNATYNNNTVKIPTQGDVVCVNNNKTGLVECSLCKEDKSINPYENWNSLKLKQNDLIQIEVRREGSSYKYSDWGLAQDSTISFQNQ